MNLFYSIQELIIQLNQSIFYYYGYEWILLYTIGIPESFFTIQSTDPYLYIPYLTNNWIFIWSIVDHTGSIFTENIQEYFWTKSSLLFLKATPFYLFGALIGDMIFFILGLGIKKIFGIKDSFIQKIDHNFGLFSIYWRIIPVFGIFSNFFIAFSNKKLKVKLLYTLLGNIFFIIYYLLFPHIIPLYNIIIFLIIFLIYRYLYQSKISFFQKHKNSSY